MKPSSSRARRLSNSGSVIGGHSRTTRSSVDARALVLARGLHEQGDLDAVVDLELVEQPGDMALDRRDGEVQRRGDLGVALAAADGERDVALARR